VAPEINYRVVQPSGRDNARQSATVVVHETSAETFAEIDRLSERMVRTGSRSDAVGIKRAKTGPDGRDPFVMSLGRQQWPGNDGPHGWMAM